MIYYFVSFKWVLLVADGEVPEQVQGMQTQYTILGLWFRNFRTEASLTTM
jgi:hypothetical protein